MDERHTPRPPPLLGAVAAIVIASCSGDSSTTTEDHFSEITYSSPGLDTGQFNGVICDMRGRFRGEDGEGHSIVVVIDASGDGSVRISDEFLLVDASIVSVEYTGQFPFEVSAMGPISNRVPLQVSVDFSEWADCLN